MILLSTRFLRSVLLPALVPLLLAVAGQSLIPGESFNLAASVLVLFSAGLYLRLLQRHRGEVDNSVEEIPRLRRLLWLAILVFILITLLKLLATSPASINLLIWPAFPALAAVLFILLTLLLQLVRLSPGDWDKKRLLIFSIILVTLAALLNLVGGLQFLIFFLLGSWIFKFEECTHISRRDKIILALFCLLALIFLAANSNVNSDADVVITEGEDQIERYKSLQSGLAPVFDGLTQSLRRLIAALLILLPLKILLHPVAEWLRSSVRIRTKLMISYLFSSVIPMLLLAVLLFCGYLFTIGSYYQKFITQLISTRASSLLDRLDLRGGMNPMMPGNRLVERMTEEGISAVLFDIGHQDRSGGGAYFVQTPFPQFHVADSLLKSMGQDHFNGLFMADSVYYMTQWAASGEWVIGVFREFTLDDLLRLKLQCGMDLTVHPDGDVRIRFGGLQAFEFTTSGSANGKILRTDTVSGSKSGLHLISLPILVPCIVYSERDEVKQSNILFTIRISPKTLFTNLFSSDTIINRVYLYIFVALTLILGAILILVVMIGFGLAGSITHSVGLLRRGTQRIGQGDLNARIFIKSNDELGQLAGSFNAMASDLGRMLEEIKDKERLEGELEAARAIQLKLLPQALPIIPGYSLAATSMPAKQVGGDYYDFLSEQAGKVDMVVGDVSGKGMPAALLMANLQASLHTLSESGLAVEDLIARLNRVLYANTDPEIFATFFFGRLDPGGEFIYVNAGHNPPILCGNGRMEQLTEGGLPLGIVQDSLYLSGRIELNPGEIVAMYSDGIVEAANQEDQEFGEKRFIELLREHCHRDPQAIQQAVLKAVGEFCGTPQDDVTLLVLKRLTIPPQVD